MKTIKRTELQSEYTKVIEDVTGYFDPIYKADGTMTECNFGGLLITLDLTGEACVIVRDWAGDEVTISEVLELEWVEDPDPEDTENTFRNGFYLDSEFITLDNFIRI